MILIPYDGLRVLMVAEDDLTCFLIVYGSEFQANIIEKRLTCVFFQGACDGNVRISRNIVRKLKNNEKLDFQQIENFEI